MDTFLTDQSLDHSIAMVGRGIRVDFIPHKNGNDVLIVTTRRDGKHESAWGFSTSVDFHRHAGMETACEISAEVRAIIARRLPEADGWPTHNSTALSS